MQQFKQKIIQLITQFRRSKKGFTLIEVVAVMAIIGVLAVALVPSIEAAMDKSTDTKMMTTLAMIDGAGKVYKLEHGQYPTKLQDLIDGKYIPDKTYDASIKYENGIATGTGAHGTLYSNGQKTAEPGKTQESPTN